ncbi:hypothetical protein IEE91_01425 [Kocuria sp. cx-455]|uniref:hypothetical protein n=1 Tax=Kocuria sp. cx-455 TaxID=2771377 RepID=UPI001689E34C|nr:hypothetical protein [Kocuria sp. cx-455]MBD2763871.1 hypothetical protein [Kocuria sp. cx-455]
MSQYVVLVEADFRSSNLNYRIRRSDTLPHAEARALFDRVVRGDEPELLKAKEDSLLVRTADNQVCRFWTGISKGESMDRITLAPVAV